MEGLVFRGVVVGGTKRLVQVGEEAEMKELVTYQVRANGRDTYISHFAPSEYLSVTNEVQNIPVYARTYTDKHGEVRFAYRIAAITTNGMKGEGF